MSSSETQLPEGLVTSDAAQRKRPHYLVLLVPALLVALLVGGGVYVFLSRHKGSTHSTSTPRTALNTSTSLQDPSGGVTAAQNLVNNAGTSQQKALAYDDLGAAYMNNKQPSQAISAYQSALATNAGSKVVTLSGLGYAYAASGQRDQAISTFQQLVTYLQQSQDPQSQQEAINFQYLIQQLQAGKTII